MRILLTGASGYLGLHVLRELVARGHQVTALVRSPQRLAGFAGHERVTVVTADLVDHERVAASLPGHEACVHAALVWDEPGTELDLTDTVVAAKLFDAAGRAAVNRLVLVSSTAVHRPFRAVMREDDPLTTADVYGATKAAAELFLWAACHTHGMQGVVLRSAPMVGPPALPGGALRGDRRLEAFVAQATLGSPLHVVRGEGRQFIAVADAARAIAVLVESSQACGVYLAVARELTTWESIARRAVELARSQSEIVVSEPSSSAPAPRFDGTRLAALVGAPFESAAAMEQHLAHLVAHR